MLLKGDYLFFSNILEANILNWKEEVLESTKLILVNFWDPECPNCEMMEPVFIELAEEYVDKLKFAKFNIMESQENQELASRYGIESTPTLMFFCQGRPVQDVVGALPKDSLRQAIDFAVQKHVDCVGKSTHVKLPYIS